MDQIVIIIAQYFIAIPVIILIILFFALKDHRRQWELFLCLLAGGLLSLLLAKLGGSLIHDPRPFVIGHFKPLIAHAADNGFPSDHTLFASFLGWLTFFYSRKLGITTLITAALIGLARVYAGVHHLEDIIGSFIITAIAMGVVGAIVIYVRKKWQPTSAVN